MFARPDWAVLEDAHRAVLAQRNKPNLSKSPSPMTALMYWVLGPRIFPSVRSVVPVVLNIFAAVVPASMNRKRLPICGADR